MRGPRGQKKEVLGGHAMRNRLCTHNLSAHGPSESCLLPETLPANGATSDGVNCGYLTIPVCTGWVVPH